MGLKFYLRGLGVGIVVTALIMGIATSVNSKEILSDDEIRERAKGLGMVEESTVLADTFAQGSVGSPEEEGTEPAAVSSPENSEEMELQKAEETSPTPEEEVAETPEGEEGKQEDGAEKGAEPSAASRATAEPSETPTTAPTLAPTPTPVSTPAPTPTPSEVPSAGPAEISAVTPTPQPAASQQQGESVTIQIVSGDSSLAVCKKLAQAGLVESAKEYDSYLCQNGYDKRIRAGSFEIPVGAGKDEIAGIILKLN